jgi:hypothetical protein
MIQVDSLLYKVDQKLNKLSSNSHQKIQLEDKILALNEAQIKLIKQKVSGNAVPSGMGRDAFYKRYDDLQAIVENYKNHPLELDLIDATLHEWEGILDDITPEYMLYVDSYVLADKGDCKNRIIWTNPDLFKHGDVSLLLNNDHTKPSFEYQETFCSISTNKISIFTDGTFEPTKLYLMYIRYPAYINKAGYVMLDGKASVDTNCELAGFLEDEILDLAVQNLAMYTENSSAVQSAQFRIQSNE